MAVLTFVLISNFTNALEGDTFFSAGYQFGNYEENDSLDVSFGGLKIDLGHYLIENLAIEGNFVFGVSDDTVGSEPFNIDVELKNVLSVL